MSLSPIRIVRPLPRADATAAVLARTSRIFKDPRMGWTLQAVCGDCAAETIAPLLIGAPIRCSGCGEVIQMDPARTEYCRGTDEGP